MILLTILVACLDARAYAQGPRSATGDARLDVRLREEAAKVSCQATAADFRGTEVVLSRGEKHVVYSLNDEGCQQTLLVVFRKNPLGGPWSHLQTIVLPLRYGVKPLVEYPEFAEKGVHEIFIKDFVSDWGTGVLQRDAVIFKLIDGKLRVIFDGPAMIRFRPSDYHLTEDVKYTVAPSEVDGVSGYSYLKVVTHVSTGKQSMQRERSCIWSESLAHFNCVETTPDFERTRGR